jgi:hypothetical protein
MRQLDERPSLLDGPITPVGGDAPGAPTGHGLSPTTFGVRRSHRRLGGLRNVVRSARRDRRGAMRWSRHGGRGVAGRRRHLHLPR